MIKENSHSKNSLLKIVLLTLSVVFLAIFSSSFLFYPFYFLAPFFSLILFVFIFNIFEKPSSSFGFFVAILSGLWLDVLSSQPLGLYMILFFLLSYLTKLILKKYVGIPQLS